MDFNLLQFIFKVWSWYDLNAVNISPTRLTAGLIILTFGCTSLPNGHSKYNAIVLIRPNGRFDYINLWLYQEPFMSIVAELIKYPLPTFLLGRCTPAVYLKWLDGRSRK